jgi:predicted nucleic acid-binding protein
MGLKNVLQHKEVYFDTNIFIYLLEGNKDFETQLLEIQALVENDEVSVFSSDLVYTELLPPHAKQGNIKSIECTIEFLSTFNLITATKEILIHAGILRGKTTMKTPDAIHVATAIASNCKIFLTNDKDILTPKGLKKVLLSETFCKG